MKRDGENSDFRPSDDFQANMNKLLTLLKSLLMSNKMGAEEFRKIIQEAGGANKDGVNIHAYFFTLMPVASDEFDDFISEFDEVEDLEGDEVEAGEDPLVFELTGRDEDFLRKNGIRF